MPSTHSPSPRALARPWRSRPQVVVPGVMISFGRIRRVAVMARPARRGTALAVALLVAGATVTACEGDGNEAAETNGEVRIVYRDDAIKPENRAAADVIRRSHVLEQFAAWVNTSVALPRDLVVNVTDKVPPGVTDAVTQPYGQTIFIPPAFLTQIHEVSSDIVNTVKRPAIFPANKFNADDLAALSTQFIFGHEMGHALQRQLQLPNLGLEEDAADGFASFYTINEVGPDPSIATALLFDEIARQEGELTLEGLASDHPVTQQRVFNYLCLLDGSDPHRFDGPLVGAGYLPQSRAPLCPTEWTALNYGWWTQLEPHLAKGFQEQGTNEQENARAEHKAQTKIFAKQLNQLRTSQ
jgi:Putative metallopeptidase